MNVSFMKPVQSNSHVISEAVHEKKTTSFYPQHVMTNFLITRANKPRNKPNGIGLTQVRYQHEG